MAKRKTRKKETEVKVLDDVKINDVPVIDDIVIEEPVETNDGFIAAGEVEEPVETNDGFTATEEAEETGAKITKETKVEEPKIEDGLVIGEKKVIKKIHHHGGRFTV